jgi:flagellar biosynthesis regulator FlbT
MTLKIELRPHEFLQIGNICRLTNGGERAIFAVDGNALILREKHLLKPADVIDSVTRLYFIIQQIGLSASLEGDIVEVLLREPAIETSIPPDTLTRLQSALGEKRYYAALTELRKIM